MKKNFINPAMEISFFNVENIVTGSSEVTNENAAIEAVKDAKNVTTVVAEQLAFTF